MRETLELSDFFLKDSPYKIHQFSYKHYDISSIYHLSNQTHIMQKNTVFVVTCSNWPIKKVEICSLTR